MTRMLLISGDIEGSDEALRRRVLRFTGSRAATRAVMARIAAARRLGRILSCMVIPTSDASADAADGWDVRVSYAAPNLVELPHG